jgi:hypothetical protein
MTGSLRYAPDHWACACSDKDKEPMSEVGGKDLTESLELVVLSAKRKAFRCRQPDGGIVTVRADSSWDLVLGEIVALAPRKRWRYAGHSYVSGTIESRRIDAAALGLVPLKLEGCGVWDPADEYWGEGDSPVPDWAELIVARGPRRQFEMEQVLPGEDPEDFDSDPIIQAVDLMNAGQHEPARELLMGLCEADIRCLDAHAHLGILFFDYMPEIALRHCEVGLRIGELSLGTAFDGLLPWGYTDNRPFLRCMQSFGLCLWRVGRFEEALGVFVRMLWLNPSDNQGIRFLFRDVKAGIPWEHRREP